MRAAVIGLAGIGRAHVDRWNRIEGVQLAAVCDIDRDLAERIGQERGVPAYGDAYAMFRKEGIDLVSFCTPPKSHLPLTRIAATWGVHVLCEKPMASVVADCRAMIDLCGSRGVRLMIGHKKRFCPPLVRLKELTEGEFGAIRFLQHRYPHPGMSHRAWFWAEDDGGGPLLENAVHAADILGYLMGDVERVYAEGASHFAERFAPQLNCAAYTLRFRSGAIASVGAGMVSIPSFSFEDYFAASDRGVAEVSGPFDNPNRLRVALRGDSSGASVEETPNADPFLLEMEHFVGCVRENAEPSASGEAGMKAVAVCRAVKLSAERAAPVDVAELLGG